MDPMAKYKGIPKKIAQEIAYYEYKYFREDLPIPFCGLFIYPAKVRDYERFLDASSCLTLVKNETLEGISMSNLEFLLSKMKMEGEEGQRWSYRFSALIDVCFGLKSGYKCPKCGKVYAFGTPECVEISKSIEENIRKMVVEDPHLIETEEGLAKIRASSTPCCPDDGEPVYPTISIKEDEKGKPVLILDAHEINASDFDRLRQIILFQNLPDYQDESWVDPNLRKDREEKLALERRQNDVHASIEKKVVCLSISTHYKFDEIYEMPIRKFSMALSTVDDLINYQITKLATMTGLVSLPKGKVPEHWIYKPEKDMYGDTYKSLSTMQAAASGVGS